MGGDSDDDYSDDDIRIGEVESMASDNDGDDQSYNSDDENAYGEVSRRSR